MKQLSGMDSMFLASERGNNYMHVASLGIYDPSTAPGGGVRFKDVLRHFTSRLEQFPQFRRRLATVPLSLDRPYWIEDSAIDVEYHVRHIALPHPGDWRQLCIQVARIHSRPLDRTKPLWEAYVIEGLHNVKDVPPGSFALYIKMHHAIVDGESGSEIMRALLSMSPEPADDVVLPNRHAADRSPTGVELYSRAMVHGVQRLRAMADLTRATARRLISIGPDAVEALRERAAENQRSVPALLLTRPGALLPKMPPETRFTGEVSAHRVFEAVGLPLADFKAIRQQVGEATVNDMFLTVVGGAIREYLARKGELPQESLLAMMPMSLRGDDKGGDRGNQVAATVVSVHTDIADPVERLRAIREKANKAKELAGKLGKELMRDVLDVVPQALAATIAARVKLPKMGLVVSNVRGPDIPLYLAGARLVNYVPISIVLDGTGLNVTGFSYAGTMWICAVSCREMLPDPAHFAECLRSAFEKLKAAAASRATAERPAARSRPRKQRAPARKPASRRKTRAAAKRVAARKAAPRG